MSAFRGSSEDICSHCVLLSLPRNGLPPQLWNGLKLRKEGGADDYIAKPFSLRELFARIRAVLRRHEMGRTARYRSPERGGYRFGRWKLERRGRRLSDHNGSRVPLSEYAILLAFLESPHRALTREYLQHATRLHEDILDRRIDVQVMRLRRKLEVDPSAPKLILTERGLGYRFAKAVDPF
jgi:two-component system, OmpR family, response regulator